MKNREKKKRRRKGKHLLTFHHFSKSSQICFKNIRDFGFFFFQLFFSTLKKMLSGKSFVISGGGKQQSSSSTLSTESGYGLDDKGEVLKTQQQVADYLTSVLGMEHHKNGRRDTNYMILPEGVQEPSQSKRKASPDAEPITVAKLQAMLLQPTTRRTRKQVSIQEPMAEEKKKTTTRKTRATKPKQETQEESKKEPKAKEESKSPDEHVVWFGDLKSGTKGIVLTVDKHTLEMLEEALASSYQTVQSKSLHFVGEERPLSQYVELCSFETKDTTSFCGFVDLTEIPEENHVPFFKHVQKSWPAQFSSLSVLRENVDDHILCVFPTTGKSVKMLGVRSASDDGYVGFVIDQASLLPLRIQ